MFMTVRQVRVPLHHGASVGQLETNAGTPMTLQQQKQKQEQKQQLRRRRPRRRRCEVHVTGALFLVACFATSFAQRPQDPSTLNGGSLLAMAGRECVAVAIDQRFGRGPALVNTQPRSVLIASPHLMVTLTGLQGDVLSLQEELLVQLQSTTAATRRWSTTSNHSSGPSPRFLASMISRMLYQRKSAPYFLEPVVVGLQPLLTAGHRHGSPHATDEDQGSSSAAADGTAQTPNPTALKKHRQVQYRPFLCSMDTIGAQSSDETMGFVCAGAATSSLYGTAQALYRPNLPPEELMPLCCKAFMSALERDCLSGYGAVIFIITPSGITEYNVKGRDD